tara:strand:+ start:238 stop:429 length:192 start_codon:yes stop_codon:yes gene_type:complete
MGYGIRVCRKREFKSTVVMNFTIKVQHSPEILLGLQMPTSSNLRPDNSSLDILDGEANMNPEH